jgi:hypothetical protein
VSGHERERLSAYLDGELPAGERAEVAAHLAACPECAAFLAALSAVDEAAGALPAEAPEGYFEAFPARVRSRLEAPRVASPGRRVPAWTWAAAAALLLGVLTPLTLRQLRPVPGEAPSAAPVAPQPVPAKPEAKVAAESRPSEPPPTAPRARPSPPVRIPPAEVAPVVGPPVAEASPRQSKDEATAEDFFSREPDAPPPPDRSIAAQAALADAESARVLGGVRSETANREKSARAGPRPAATNEVVSPALSEASAGREGEPADLREREDAFLRLEAVRPRSAGDWRRLRDEWNAFAADEADPVRADEARVRAIVAGREAWLASGDGSDESTFRRDAAAYLRREDDLQKPRVERLLAEPRPSP